MYNKDILISGAGSEVVTPFTKEGLVDHKLLHDEITFMLDNGVSAIFVNGLASEFLMMGERESFEVARTVIDACKDRAPVIGNVYANSTYRGCDMAKCYKECGVDALMIYTPYIYPYTKNGMFEYCSAVGQATDLPMYICNVSDTSNKFSPDLIADIFKANENFVGYKDGTQIVIDQLTILSKLPKGRKFDLISGSDGLLMTTMMNGGVGIISLVTTVFPALVVETVQACQNKEWEKARRLQYKLIRVREALKTGPFMAAYKYAARLTGRSLGYMRAPLQEVSEEQGAKIEKILQDEGMI